jgi:hypothetical protein
MKFRFKKYLLGLFFFLGLILAMDEGELVPLFQAIGGIIMLVSALIIIKYN